MQPTPVYCLENPHGQRSVEGYSLWVHKELDMAEQLSTAQHTLIISASTYLPYICRRGIYKDVYCYFVGKTKPRQLKCPSVGK